ncbi:hypothetical protein B0H67DRAFT_482567 [Lasiosphaeris hirsuta]|uniref:Uncharacterized protein n=1 Tax=Lasiosphaeris hirsuta TaxID=260670 RepID=A0AA40B013_9PEZI|nr:hypothetical protein B0H67DRAFT_482567 [Lasiosphaeris hirsuta]
MSTPSNDSVDALALALVEHLWRPSFSTKKRLFNGDPARDLTHDTYCEYYRGQWHLVAGNSDGRYVAVQTADATNWLAQELATNPTKTREEILERLKSKYGLVVSADDEAWDTSVNLAARLLLMLKFGVVKHQRMPRRYLSWTSASLQSFVKDHFDVAPVLNCDHLRLPKTFDAWGVFAIAGIEIDFTDNLADHLLLVEDDSKVLIFHHASFLECQDDSLFPDGLVDETLRTLALLFPQSEFSKQKTRHHCTVDPRLTLCGNLQAEDRQIERFRFWRDRLVILKQAYDDATPRTLSQWWCDRRNGVQWYTFWVAILVLLITTFLGLMQCIEGALQVYRAYVPAMPPP